MEQVDNIDRRKGSRKKTVIRRSGQEWADNASQKAIIILCFSLYNPPYFVNHQDIWVS